MKSTSKDRLESLAAALRSPDKRLFSVYCALSLFAVFYVPYFVPVPPSTSDSYIFGYNNRVGIILLLLLVSIAAIWTKGLHFNFAPAGTSFKIPLKYLWFSLAAESAACAGMYGIARQHPVISEAEQQINRVWLTSLGKTPYIDFEWPWGPIFLYIPKWISSLFHLSIPQAYFVFWILCSLLGVALLFATINLVDLPATRKTSIFVLLFLFAILAVQNMGTNYSLVRYLCPTLFILIVYQVRGPLSQPGPPMRAAALCFLFTVILLTISPEVTIAFAFASIILLFPRSPSSRRSMQTLAYLALVAALAILFFSARKARFFDSLVMDSHGGNSLPIILAPPTLLFFATVFVCACYLVQRISQPAIRDNTVALIAFAVPMLAAALGRADPGHMVLNGMGFFIAAFSYASNSPRLWRFSRNAFVLCFLVLIPLPGSLLSLYSFTRPAPPPFPYDVDISSLYRPSLTPLNDRVFAAPFGYVPNARGAYYSSQIDYGFYDGLWDATTPDSYRTKIDELAQHPQRPVLIRHGVFGACDLQPTNNRIWISVLFTFPYTATPLHRDSIRKPLCDYISTHYSLTEPATIQNFQYELWRPTP
jgi:uncharacterized integral membrane protein